MTKCQNCQSDIILTISGKTSDCFNAQYKGKDYDGYVLSDIGIGGGDYIEFSYCLECGQIQDKFPIKESVLTEQFEEGDDDDEN